MRAILCFSSNPAICKVLRRGGFGDNAAPSGIALPSLAPNSIALASIALTSIALNRPRLMPARIPLTRERIAQAALALVDAVGLESFTMRGLGQQLGVDPMAIYHHLPNKDAVFDAIVEELWSGVARTALRKGGDWQTRLFALFQAVRRHLLAHPRAALLMGTRPATTPALLRLIDQTLGHIAADDLPAQETMALLDCLMAFTVGKVLGEISQHQQPEKVAAAVQSLTPQDHPHLMQALAAGYAFAPDAQFEHGLRVLIAGWGAAPAPGGSRAKRSPATRS